MPKVIIIGGGIAGLAAAVHLKQGAKVHDKQLDVLVLVNLRPDQEIIMAQAVGRPQQGK